LKKKSTFDGSEQEGEGEKSAVDACIASLGAVKRNRAQDVKASGRDKLKRGKE